VANEAAGTAMKDAPKKHIVFFGNSLTAGYGLPPDSAFPALVQARIDSLQLPWKVVAAGLSGETTASGRNRVNWIVSRHPVDIFVLELGANDGLRGIEPTETATNLAAIIDSVQAQWPEVNIVLAGMMVPPNMGAGYSKAFQAVFPKVAKEKKAVLIPFLLEGVGGVPELNLPDGIHPTEAGHRIVAETVWTYIKPLLGME
jgi:acyl-CoA thioesterase-1